MHVGNLKVKKLKVKFEKIEITIQPPFRRHKKGYPR